MNNLALNVGEDFPIIESGDILNILESSNITGILDLQKIAESKHFTFHARGLAISDEDLRKNDRHLEMVCTRMGFKCPKDKINYIYLDSSSGGDMKGGFPLAGDNLIVSKKSFHPHEIAHFLMHSNLGKSHPVLDEGIAVLNGWGTIEGSCRYEGRPIEEWIKIFEDVNILPTLEQIFTDFRTYPQDRSYPVAAYICRNILENYGTPFFIRFFKNLKATMTFNEISEIFEEMTHQKIKDIY